MFRRLLALLALYAIAPSTAWAEGKVSLDIAGNTVELEVATTTIEQRTGLMNRAMLAEDSGMLFVFAEPRSVAMWMKNTLIDLDAAFVDACGFILNIETMQKGTLDLHRSQGPTLSVIEMNAGWFARHGVRSGYYIPALRSQDFCKSPQAKSK